MKKTRHATYLALGLLVIFMLTLTVSIEWVARQISPQAAEDTPLPIAPGSETTVHSVNIYDLALYANRFENYNHVSGRFLRPLEEIENEEGSTVGGRGTYIFIVSSLDISDPDYEEKKESLAKYKGGDNLYHITFYLPALHGSAVVYLNAHPVAQIGSIKDYHYIDYTSETTTLREHKNASEPMYIDLAFDINRLTNSYDNLKNCNIITIHYETEWDYAPGLSGESPLIGNKRTVTGVVENNKLVLIVLTILSFISVLFALFASIVRDKEMFLPFTISTFGFFGVVITSFFALNPTNLIYSLGVFQNFSYIMILFGGCCSLPQKIGRLYIRRSLIVPFLVIGVLLAIVPFAPSTYQIVCRWIWQSYFLIAIVLIIFYIIYAVWHGHQFRTLFCPTMVLFLLAHRMFSFSAYAAILSPMFWYSSIIMLYSSYHIFMQIWQAERDNLYLTRNLKAEVKKQTESLERAVVERENAMRFLSHDLRKPTRTIDLLMSTLIAREDDPEQIKTMQIVVQKLRQIEQNLSQVSRAFKESFVAEASENINIAELLREIYEALEPDCAANGIHLNYYPSPVTAFVKKQALSSVITNLVVNAIEHANCDRIAMTVYKKASQCIITVADNGSGFSKAISEADPFGEYQSSDERDDTHGLGLYICRTYVESMHGTLEHEYTNGELIFTIKLPLA